MRHVGELLDIYQVMQIVGVYRVIPAASLPEIRVDNLAIATYYRRVANAGGFQSAVACVGVPCAPTY